MKAPITDTMLGIKPDASGKFREVRQKAHDEYIERAKKRKKDPEVTVPKYAIGDKMVVVDGYKTKHYHLVEVVDFNQDHGSKDFSYFGIILKTTDKTMLSRIGRLIKTSDWGYYMMPRIENIPASSIKWIDKTKGTQP